MTKYRIALVTDKYLPIFGGLELYLHDLAHELTLRGHEVHVICATPGAPDDEIFSVHRIATPRVLYRAASPLAVGRLQAILRAGRFDLVHAHCIFSPLAHAATFLARKLGIPSLFTLHSVLHGVGGVTLSLLNRAFGWGRWPTIISAVSHYVAAELTEVTGRDDVEVILNAAHVDRWQLARPEKAELRVVSAMRFTLRKQPTAFVRIVPEVLARLPRALWPKFTLIGDGPERRRVEREVARLGIAEHVELPGFLPRPAIAELLARAALFVVPSAREALSIVAIEARAAGLPVVARVPSGVAEVVEDGVHGLHARSSEELVAAIVRLMSDGELRRRMSQVAARDLERFAWPRCLERHEELYARAVSARR
jgi:glycosyltransferase involved in cell wall biosynthesis